MKNIKILFLFTLFPVLLFGQTQIGEDIDGEAERDRTRNDGLSMSFDGSIVAIGAAGNDGNGDNSGHVRVYRNLSGIWMQVGSDIDGESEVDASGSSVSLSCDGSIVAIGAPLNNGNAFLLGHVRIFQNIDDVWTQIGDDIDGESEFDGLGSSVSLSCDGSIVAIGAPSNNGSLTGYVRIFQNMNGVWTQIGDDIDGEESGDTFGRVVNLNNNGSIVAISAPLNFSSNIPYVSVFENNNGNWEQLGQRFHGQEIGNRFGRDLSLSCDGSLLAIGISGNDGNGEDSGSVRVFENTNGIWTQIGDDINGESEQDFSGSRVSLSCDGSLLAIGAIGNNGNGKNSGHVRIFKNINGIWTQVGDDIDGEESGDLSGDSISLSRDGTVIAIGAPNNDGNEEDSGHVRVFDLISILEINETTLSEFKLYPNPTTTTLNITLKEDVLVENITIFNALNQIVKSSKKTVIDVSQLATGSYYVEIKTNKGTGLKKLLIE